MHKKVFPEDVYAILANSVAKTIQRADWQCAMGEYLSVLREDFSETSISTAELFEESCARVDEFTVQNLLQSEQLIMAGSDYDNVLNTLYSRIKGL